MPKLQSSKITITGVKKEISVFATRTLMPVDGDVYVWYGSFPGTDAELLAQGMPIPMGKYLEHVAMHSGIISIITDGAEVTVHEVH